MFSRSRLQTLAVLAVGLTAGYLAASGKFEALLSAEQKVTAPASPATPCPDGNCADADRAATLAAISANNEKVAANRQKDGQKPNVLFIMGDDIGWMQPGCYHRGLMVGETPNIDRLAKEGGQFMHYYAESSCTAGRCAFVTEMNPMRAGMLLPQLPGAISYLRPGTPCIGQFMLDSATPVSSVRTTSATTRTRCRRRTGSRNSGATSTTSTPCRG
jgi:hypothetical protein